MSHATPRTLAVTAIAMVMLAPFLGSASANETPTAMLDVPSTVVAGSLVTLDGSASSDTDGTIAAFNFSVAGVVQPIQATPTLDVTLTEAGTTEVSLVVTDDLGADSAPATAAIEVLAGPVASLEVTGPATIPAGLNSTFTLTGLDAFGNVNFSESFLFLAPAALGPVEVCETRESLSDCLDVTVVIGPVHRIDVDATRATVNIGRTSTISAIGYDIADHVVEGLTFTMSATHGTIDSASGVFTATSAGTATITVTNGTVSGQILVRVTPSLATSITVADAIHIADAFQNGVSGTIAVNYVDGAAASGTAKVFFTDPLGATTEISVDVADGIAEFTSDSQMIPGEYTVSVSSTSGANYGADVETYEVFVVPA